VTWPPPAFAIDDPAQLDAILARVGLGTLITQGPDGFLITHMPFVYDPATKSLRGHISRANPHAAVADASPAVVIFNGLDAYVTPTLYPSKAVHGKVAPTWNYEVLHIHGPLIWHPEADWLKANLEALTDKNEAGRAEPWRVDDAPADYTAKLIGQIIGIEIPLARIDGRRKFSQNRNEADRQGVITGLAASANPNDQKMAAAMLAIEDQ
jgi:transcriptional regulator